MRLPYTEPPRPPPLVALLLDRADRHSTTEQHARALTNPQAVASAARAALEPFGIELRLLRAADHSLVSPHVTVM